MKDEFFVDEAPPAELAGFEHLPIPPRVVTKQHFDALALNLTDALLEENSSLEAYVRIKNVAEVLDCALTHLREQAISQVSGTSQNVLGVTVMLKGLPKKWEYDDSVLIRLEGEKAALEARIKERKRFLEHLKQEVADTLTGEIIHPARCVSDGVTIQVLF
jgi:hypothetical protein